MAADLPTPFRIASFHSNYTAPCAVTDYRPQPSSCQYSGFIPELLYVVLTLMNVSYEIIPISQEFISLDNGRLTPIMFATAMGEYDVVAYTTNPILQKVYSGTDNQLLQSYPVLPSESYGFLTKRRDYDLNSNTWLPYKIFEPEAWILLICWYFPAKYALKHLKVSQNSNGFRGLVWITAFFFALFCNLYKGKLLAELLGVRRSVKYSNGWEIIDEIEQGNLIPIVHFNLDYKQRTILEKIARVGSKFDHALLHATLEHALPFGNKSEREVISMMLENDNYVYASAYLSSVPFYKSINCDLVFIGELSQNTQSQTFPVFSKSKYYEKFNWALIEAQGYKNNIWMKYNRFRQGNSTCVEKGANSQAVPKPLSMLNMWGSFASLNIGIFLGLVALLIERSLKIARRNRRVKFQTDNITFAKERFKQNLKSLGMIEHEEINWNTIAKVEHLMEAARENINFMKEF